jgi:hypothetical protein
MRRILGPNREEVTGDWKKLHHEELHDLSCILNIIRMIKSRRLKWAGHVTCVRKKRNVHRVLVGKPEGKRPLGRTGHRCRGTYGMIKISLTILCSWFVPSALPFG